MLDLSCPETIVLSLLVPPEFKARKECRETKGRQESKVHLDQQDLRDRKEMLVFRGRKDPWGSVPTPTRFACKARRDRLVRKEFRDQLEEMD